ELNEPIDVTSINETLVEPAGAALITPNGSYHDNLIALPIVTAQDTNAPGPCDNTFVELLTPTNEHGLASLMIQLVVLQIYTTTLQIQVHRI
ncbi:hypothetical protein HAX54_010751, partial [Datura stramonium]|nr:hypothetical protein [Datura stramonium]